MPSWAAMRDEVYIYTNRPELVAETTAALKNAIRTAHKSGKFWRDLVITNVATAIEQIQTVNLNDSCPRFRGLAYVRDATEQHYKPTDIQDLLDADNYAKTNICYGIGTTLKIRAASPQETYEIAYYQYPAIDTGVEYTDWLMDQYDDLVYLWAAATILGTTGESEIKQRLEAMAAIGFADLLQDNIEITGR